MRHILFFSREAFRSLKLHYLSNITSIICISMALLILCVIVGMWSNVDNAVNYLRDQAEIVLYLEEDTSAEHAQVLANNVSTVEGVTDTSVVTPEETMKRIQGIVGDDMEIMEVLDGFNPFSPSIEVAVLPESAMEVAERVGMFPAVERVRDNEEIIAPLIKANTVVRGVGMTFGFGVVFVTVVLTSHIVRLGIAARKREIETLRLLGASELFVAMPFIFEGAILGTAGSLLSIAFILWGLPSAYDVLQTSIPFIPMVPLESLVSQLIGLVLALGIISGTLGSLIALRS